MALLFTSTVSSVASSPSSSTSAATPANPFLWFCNKSVALLPRSYPGCRLEAAPFVVSKRDALLVVKASSDVDGAGEPPTPPPSDSSTEEESSVPVENLPLESKLQLKLEQKMKMKMAKKIRLRRKRLVRKRHLRKKGRWPPSKLKKNKNV